MSVYLTLRTAENKSTSEKIINELKETFGKWAIDILEDYGNWQPVRISDAGGWISINDTGFSGKSRIHIFRKDTELKYDIALDDIDTIYNI